MGSKKTTIDYAELARRFDELAKSDPTIEANLNVIHGRTAYLVRAKNQSRRTFHRLAAMAQGRPGEEALGGIVDEFLARLFEHAPGVMVHNGGAGDLQCYEIRNAAEAASIMLTQFSDSAESKAALTKADTIKLLLTKDPGRKWTVASVASEAGCSEGHVKRDPTWKAWRDNQAKSGRVRRGYKTVDGSLEAVDDE
ncbi:MAG: hypothetical protein GC162_16355 [Planctomycetes bacterium]|nr:hypothetical protein [Planctomycetota bacterium]